MRSPRQLFVILIGVGLFFLFLLGNSGTDRVVLMADEADELAFLPVIFSAPPLPTATPTVSPTESATPEETATSTPEETTTAEPTESPSATPTNTATASPTATDTAEPTETPTITLTPDPDASAVYFPVIAGPPVPALEVPIPVSKEPPIDFEEERAKAQEMGQDLAFNKIGFHILQFGTRDGLQEYIESLDSAGVPAVLKTANDAQYIYEAQKLAKVSGVEHVLIYRDATQGRDIPDYELDPITAARLNWAENRRVFPPELDPALVWMETTNEPDRTKSAWLAEFALEQAKTAVREGARFAAFGWSSGEPEREHWESPEMLEFLRYAADHPDQVAVALHEYSFVKEDIGNDYPDLIGRLQTLFDVADEHGIPRPTVLITEWGWEYNKVPEPEQAMADIEWASWLYAAYPQVKGVAIWTLGVGGGEFGSIGEDVQKFLAPVTDYSLGNYFLYSPGTRPVDADALAPPEEPATPTPTTDPNETPTVTPTPTNTPTPSATPSPTIIPTADPDNPLRNGSFEEGWTDVAGQKQQPNGWVLSWVPANEPLPPEYEPNGTIITSGTSEDIHKDKVSVDPPTLVIDGNWVYKMFTGFADAGHIWATTLSQTIDGMPPGAEYRLTVPIQLHKAPDPDPWGSETSIWVNGNSPGWANQDDMGDHRWCKHETVFEVPTDGRVEIDLRIKTKWKLAKNFFVDDVRLEPAANPPVHTSMDECLSSSQAEQVSPFRLTVERIINFFKR